MGLLTTAWALLPLYSLPEMLISAARLFVRTMEYIGFDPSGYGVALPFFWFQDNATVEEGTVDISPALMTLLLAEESC